MWFYMLNRNTHITVAVNFGCCCLSPDWRMEKWTYFACPGFVNQLPMTYNMHFCSLTCLSAYMCLPQVSFQALYYYLSKAFQLQLENPLKETRYKPLCSCLFIFWLVSIHSYTLVVHSKKILGSPDRGSVWSLYVHPVPICVSCSYSVLQARDVTGILV